MQQSNIKSLLQAGKCIILSFIVLKGKELFKLIVSYKISRARARRSKRRSLKRQSQSCSNEKINLARVGITSSWGYSSLILP
jgi:hypothetical protein